MATLTVRNLDNDTVRRLRIRAAEHGRSAEAEHREILRAALAAPESRAQRAATAEHLAAFRRRTADRGSHSVEALLAESRGQPLQDLWSSDRKF
ncbi:MAG: plasmid stabilization protein [Acetobacteraceae bacterium]|nr:plasmid stabilization protein [Acetobacteraceae bacterium]